MTRELPLLIGAIGTVLGFVSLLWEFFLVAIFSGSMSEPGNVISLSAYVFLLSWAISPFIGLAGAFNVKKRGGLGGVLFAIAGALPLIVSWGTLSLWALELFFWTPLLVVAGVLAILNLPGPYVDKEELEGMAGESSTRATIGPLLTFEFYSIL
jgi:hypothetical protein